MRFCKRYFSLYAMAESKTILIITQADDGFSREIIRGVARYARSQSDWKLLLRPQMPPASDCRGMDGILSILSEPGHVQQAREAGIPLVSVSGLLSNVRAWQVLGDDRAVARMAAGHFLSRGFEQFAFVGETRIDPCRTRYEEFARAVQHPCRLCDLSHLDFPGNQAVDFIAQWLVGQPLPLAVMAFNDPVGRWVTEACSLRGLHVPSDVALLGVDNDEVVCELSSPTLSSIYPNTRLRGRLAAELLAKLMEGQPVGQKPLLVPPGRIFHRQSSDTLAFGDQDVRIALRFIRCRATDPIDVEDVMEQVSCSRRTLETRFSRLLGRSLHEQIWNQRISRASQWLLESDMTITQIALRCGSASPSAFTQSFRRYVGMPPSQYRRNGGRQWPPMPD